MIIFLYDLFGDLSGLCLIRVEWYNMGISFIGSSVKKKVYWLNSGIVGFIFILFLSFVYKIGRVLRDVGD